MHKDFFKDLKVVELAAVLAGPAVGMFFAELGANVIKVENKTTGGDVTRKWKLPGENPEKDYSSYYCCVNWNKESIFLNLKTEEDQRKVHELIREADVVVANSPMDKARLMKVDYESLKQINPQLIFAQLNSFPNDDTIPAFDIVLQAEAGFLHMCGEADGPPVRMPVALIDLLAAHQLKQAILVALLRREKTGEGSYVETSLYESAIASLANQATNYLMAGHIPQRLGSTHPNIAPYGDLFTTRDGKQIVTAIGTDRQFAKLCGVLGLGIHKDEKFATNEARVKNRSELQASISREVIKYDQKEIIAKCKEEKIPAGAIKNMKEVFENVESQKMILESEMPDGEISRRVKTVAFKIK